MNATPNQPGSQLQILKSLEADYGDEVFTDFTILLVQHLLPDSEPFIDAFLYSCLRQHLFVVGIPYSSRGDVLELIKQRLSHDGICVPPHYPFYEGKRCDVEVKRVFDAALETCQGQQKLLIVEDGAYALPYMMQNRPDAVPYCVGAVQQTTRGLTVYKRLRKELMNRGVTMDFPVLPIVKCELKSRHEPRWIVPAILDNVRTLLPMSMPGLDPAEPFKGLTVTVVGLGPIGEALTRVLNQQGAAIRIVEKGDPQGVLRKLMASDELDLQCGPLARFAPESDVIFGCTGSLERPSIGRSVFSHLKDGTVLISTSSGNEEIDIKGLEAISTDIRGELPQSPRGVMLIPDFTTYSLHDGRKIVVLYGGFPINFWSRESMRSQHGDVILSLLFCAAAKIALGKTSKSGILDGDKRLKAEQATIARRYSVFYGK